VHYREEGPGVVWVEEALEDRWVAAYRIAPQDGRPVITEVRVFPRPRWFEPTPVPDPEEVYRYPGQPDPAASIPPGGLPSSLLRKVRLGPVYGFLANRVSAQAWAVRAADFARLGFEAPAEGEARTKMWADHLLDLGFEDFVYRPGRRGREDLWFAQLAAAYVRFLEKGSRAPVRDLTAWLREDTGEKLSEESVRQLVHEARKGRGMLTDAPSGRAGGALTPKARELLKTTPKRQNRGRKK
jgi:hypothetical protein